MSERFIRMVDCELDEPLTLQAVADAVGARPPLLARLIRLGLLDSVGDEVDEPLLPTRAVISLIRLHRTTDSPESVSPPNLNKPRWRKLGCRQNYSRC